MQIDVLPFKPRDVISKRPVDGGQYQIRVDGRLVGFIGYHNGARAMLHERFSPLELKEIERAVRVKLTPQMIGGIVQVPEKSKETKAGPKHDNFD